MYFLQISDTHYLEDYRLNHDLFETAFLNITNPLEKLEQIKGELQDISLDFILHCGDMCHSGQKADYQNYKGKMEACFPSVPLMVTCGNRDDKDVLQEVFLGKVEEHFVYGRQFGDLQVISFHNANGTPQGELTEEVCQLVLAQLKKTSDIPTILFCHHHCIPDQIPSMKAVECPTLFDEVMAQKNVIALLTGHTHHHFVGEYAGVPCYTVAPLSFVAKATEDGQEVFEAGGYHVFSYEEGKLSLVTVGDLGIHHSIGKTK